MPRVGYLALLLTASLLALPRDCAGASEFEPPLGIYARYQCKGPSETPLEDPNQFSRAADAYAGTLRLPVQWGQFQPGGPGTWSTGSGAWKRIKTAGEAGFSVQLDIYTRCLDGATDNGGFECSHIDSICPAGTQPKVPSFPPDSVVTSFGDHGWYPEYYDFVRKLIAKIEDEGITVRWVVIEGEASRHSAPWTCGNQWAGTFEQYAKLLQTAYKAVHDTTLTGARVADSGLGSEWWGLMPAYMKYVGGGLDSTFVAYDDPDMVAWTNSYFLGSTVECFIVSPDTLGWETKDQLVSTVTSGLVAGEADKAWDYLVAIRDLADSTGEPIMDALNVHLYDGYDCATAGGEICTSCFDDIRFVTSSFFEDVFPSGLPLITNEMGRNKLSADGRGWEDDGDPMAWQTLKMLVRGIADSLEYINWYQLEEPFNVDACRWAFYDLDSTSTECPVGLNPAWPDSPGVYQSHNPRWSYYAFQDVAKRVNPDVYRPYNYKATERYGYVDRFIFQQADYPHPWTDVSYMWLHERAPVDASYEVTIDYPVNWIVGWALWDYKGNRILHTIAQDSLLASISYEPVVLEWEPADLISWRDSPGASSAWTLEKGTSLEFQTIAVVEGDTLDLTPFATVEKVSEDPNWQPPSTSFYDHILTVTFGNQDTCSVILRMTWNGVTQDSAFMQITRDECALQGTQDSVRLTPTGSVECVAPWAPFASQARAYSHFAGSVYDCNVTAASNTVWSSTDSTVASVDSLGRVTPLGEGTCSIVVTTGAASLRDTLDLTVSE